jgi:sec-independent protein translocase protein TatC
MSEYYPPGSQRLDLIGHLAELRRRILICIVCLLVVTVVLFSQGYSLLAVLEAPAHGSIQEFIFTGPTEAFVTYCKVVLLAAFVVCFPVVLYQTWAFLAPAMPRTSRRAVVIWLTFALVSFVGGLAFAYGILLPSAFKFLVGFGAGIARPMISVAEYISFAVAIILVGGFVFEIPFIMGLLTEVGVLNSRILRASRRYAIFIIFIVAAIITPTQDAFNMLLFAVPMVLLFEVGVLLTRFIERRKAGSEKN